MTQNRVREPQFRKTVDAGFMTCQSWKLSLGETY